MVIRVSNKNINRYKYTKRKIQSKRKTIKKADISFGDIFENIKRLKAEGLLSISNVDSSIANTITKLKIQKNIHGK